MAYAEYKGRCVGRLMYFLYAYNHITDECLFSGSKESPMITLFGNPFDNYEWDGDTDIPTFTFLGKYIHLNDVQEQRKPEVLQYATITTEIELREEKEKRNLAIRKRLQEQIKTT